MRVSGRGHDVVTTLHVTTYSLSIASIAGRAATFVNSMWPEWQHRGRHNSAIRLYSIRFWELTSLGEAIQQLRWSSPVQKEASAFLYISHTSGYFMGNIQKRSGLSASRGSVSWGIPGMAAAPESSRRRHTSTQTTTQSRLWCTMPSEMRCAFFSSCARSTAEHAPCLPDVAR